MNKEILKRAIDTLRALTDNKRPNAKLMYVLGLLESLEIHPQYGTPAVQQPSNLVASEKMDVAPRVVEKAPSVEPGAMHLATLPNPHDKRSSWGK